MSRIVLFTFLFLICISDVLPPNSPRYDFNNTIGINLPFENTEAIVDASEMCKPTGVETVIYTEGKTEPAPEKKKTVTKIQKKKAVKKAQPKKA